jgi:hypothetical protein
VTSFRQKGVFLVWLGLWLLTAACDQRELSLTEKFVRPKPRPAPKDHSCQLLAKNHKDSEWLTISAVQIGKHQLLTVEDPMVLGGPFAPAMHWEVPEGEYPVRLLVGNVGTRGKRPWCARVVWGKEEIVQWEPAGDIVVTSDMVVFTDHHAYLELAKNSGKKVVSAVEVRAVDMPKVLAKLKASGLELELAMPNLARARRNALPGDRALVEQTLRDLHIAGQYLEEPDAPVWELARALGENTWAKVRLPGLETGSAIVVQNPAGDGAYVVAKAVDAQQKIQGIELRLNP